MIKRNSRLNTKGTTCQSKYVTGDCPCNFPIYTAYKDFALPLIRFIQSVQGGKHCTCPIPRQKNLSAVVLSLVLVYILNVDTRGNYIKYTQCSIKLNVATWFLTFSIPRE